MSKRKIIVGETFLHSHPVTEKQLHLIKDCVVVDREDWEAVCKFFKHGSAVTWALEECINSKHGVSAPELEQNAGTACEDINALEAKINEASYAYVASFKPDGDSRKIGDAFRYGAKSQQAKAFWLEYFRANTPVMWTISPEKPSEKDPAPEQNAGTACEGPKNLVKPPLGIMPRKLWIEIRLKELSEAMYRYISVGSPIPEEWAQEYNQLLSELQK